MLGFALFAATGYAAFAQGAIQPPAEPRLQVGLAVIAMLAAAAGLWGRRLTFVRSRATLTGLGLLGGFTLWSAASLLWSVDPPGTWTEVNRLLAYVLVLGLALVYGSSAPEPVAAARTGLLALVGAVTVAALGQKLAPGLHVAGVFDLNGAAAVARLQSPLGYWNALGLVEGLAAPAALSIVVRTSTRPPARAGALVLIELIVVTIGFSESRGAFGALAVAIAVSVMLSPDRLAMLLWAVAGTAGGALILALGLLAHPLTANGVALGPRELAGLWLVLILASVATLSSLAIPVLDGIVSRLRPRNRKPIWRLLGSGTLGLLMLMLVAAAISHRGLAGQIDHLWTSFNRANSIAASGADRLFSASSANRVDWWGQALAAGLARPLEGFGSGAFGVIDLLFRHTRTTAADAHEVPLQWLAETGVVGAGLALAAWVSLVIPGLAAVREAGGDRVDPTRMDTEPARRRLEAGALLAPAIAYSVHALYDWDWDIPGVTVPVLIALGVLIAGTERQRTELARRRSVHIVPAPAIARAEPGPTLRIVALLALSATLTLYAISATLPSAAAGTANRALAEAAVGTPGALVRARRDAARASALDPLSDAGDQAAADVAVGAGELELARVDLLDAVTRQPADASAWRALADLDVKLGHEREALRAAARALHLDPELGPLGLLNLASEAVEANVGVAPPQASPTAQPTP